ncbi:MAG TPA: iron-containing redox enzyme family protein [Acidimicrobiales bacterium]|jgi:pyrroloquinoline quinone (PQQ) biosynthesis protein C|nr:iron-containing redox enzyme family protein [Acidimicrobiales bacterium]
MPTNQGQHSDPIEQALEAALAGRMLLTHPFYLRWEAGELSPDELARYSSQYRHFEATLPGLLEDLSGQLTDAGSVDAAAIVGQNLRDERGNPCPHLELFDRFVTAVGGAPAAPSTATSALTSTYADLVREGAVAGLAGLAAYETQASAIAWTKAEGLRFNYGIDAEGTSFWDVHATMEAEHGDWILDALASLDARPDQVAAAARRGADAWWGFLDDREAEASVAIA